MLNFDHARLSNAGKQCTLGAAHVALSSFTMLDSKLEASKPGSRVVSPGAHTTRSWKLEDMTANIYMYSHIRGMALDRYRGQLWPKAAGQHFIIFSIVQRSDHVVRHATVGQRCCCLAKPKSFVPLRRAYMYRFSLAGFNFLNRTSSSSKLLG